MSATEYVILVNEQNQAIGVEEKLRAHQKNLLHRAFSVFVFDAEATTPRLLLQQRAFNKYHSPGLWTNTCCSHPRKHEMIVPAGERRLAEEMGITMALKDVGWFHYNAHFENGLSEHEIDHVLVGWISSQNVIQPNPAEVHAYRWVDCEVLNAELEKTPNSFTPWFKQAFKIALGHT